MSQTFWGLIVFQGTRHWSHFWPQCFRSKFWSCSFWWVTVFIITSPFYSCQPNIGSCCEASFLFWLVLSWYFISFSLVLCLFSTGFPKTLSFSVFNTSCVTLTFTLRILGDGRGSSSVSYEEHLSHVSRNNPPFFSERISVRPAEFTISPRSGSVSPQSHVTIQVKLGFFYAEWELYFLCESLPVSEITQNIRNRFEVNVE